MEHAIYFWYTLMHSVYYYEELAAKLHSQLNVDIFSHIHNLYNDSLKQGWIQILLMSLARVCKTQFIKKK